MTRTSVADSDTAVTEVGTLSEEMVRQNGKYVELKFE
jgi:hypothetical protein